MKSLMLNFSSPCEKYVLAFDDNGRVAYAYLKQGGAVSGAVWLYNRCPTPAVPEWSDRAKIPFALSDGYVREGARLEQPIGPDSVHVAWEYEASDKPVAYVYIFADLYAVIGSDDHVGYARFALRSSPLAKVMEFES